MIVIKNERLRKAIKTVVPFVLIPVTVFVGAVLLDESMYLPVSIGVAVMAVLLFAAGYEKKPTGSRRLVITAVMTALCVAGRFIPFFKPITAITIITALYIGGESGFLVGAMAALLSNFYFGQGPWTPFQMLAWGMTGLIAGFFFVPLKKNKAMLVAYGVISGIAYSMLMDIWTIVWYNGSFNLELYLAALLTALPHTIMYAVSNFIFLWFMAKPFGDKLERVKIKYGV